MAEVIEVNMICKKEIDLDIALSFLKKIMEGEYENTIYEAMDDWEYKNPIYLQSQQEAMDYIQKKIVCITEHYSNGVAGLYIEKIKNKYCYEIWFNSEIILKKDSYLTTIKKIIKFITDEWDDYCCILASIGKEVMFEYEDNIYNIIKKSHGIDNWIIAKNEYNNICSKEGELFSQFKKYIQKNYIIQTLC